MPSRPRVFISYSHDDEDHKTLVRRFAEFLYKHVGLEVHLDQWVDGARIDWSKWALRQLKAADYTLAIASPLYRRRTDGEEHPHVGWGSQFEGAVLRDQLTGDIDEYTARILPIVLPGRAVEEIPQFLNPHSTTHYPVRRFSADDDGVRSLVRAIARKPENPGPAEEPGVFVGGTFTPFPARRKLLLTTELKPVAKGPDVRLSAVRLNGVHYGNGISYRCSMFCSEPRGQVEYDLGRRYRAFETTVGVLDDAADAGQTGHFEVFLDDVAQPGAEVKLGSPATLTLDVSEVLRLRLVAYRTDTTEHPMLAGARIAGGLSNGLPELGWGDPVLYT
ncbi:SEFIR domain-containing protein [Amycolatopsis circi]|uniref:SEFIR domain-containing protein n=1 Tax=Amycolatopsis circi TaxID=871959 RepID=UPI000E24B1C1|nr:SEFIR domain-containing protein [Amycolatopsis circi]